MSFGRYQRGQMVRFPPATVQDELIDIALERKRGRRLPQQPSAKPRDPAIIFAKNDSSAERNAGEPLCLGTSLVTTLTNEAMWLNGIAPATGSSFGLTRRYMPEDAIDELQLFGPCMARVSVGHASHTHADVVTGTSTLVSGFHGCPILYKPSGTGTKDCIVLLGQLERGPYKAKADSTISAGSSGTVSIWLDGTDSGANETAYLSWIDNGGSISSGSELYISWFPADGKWRITNAEC